jgi:hypothetical protein
MIIDTVRDEINEQAALCEQSAKSLDGVREAYFNIRNDFADKMSAVFCAFNFLEDNSLHQENHNLVPDIEQGNVLPTSESLCS